MAMKFNFDNDFKLRIEIELGEKLQLLSEMSRANNATEPMIKWFDDPNVPQAEKDKYSSSLTNALAEMSFLCNLLKKCGISKNEILEIIKIPF